MNDRNNYFELKIIYSKLHARYQNFLLKMNKFVKNIINNETKKIVFKNQIKTFAKFKQCVQNIQMLSEFDHFYKKFIVKQMQNCLTMNNIVTVNIVDFKNDVVIIIVNRFKKISFFYLSADQIEN